jgi:arylamine N-acetyltransferase
LTDGVLDAGEYLTRIGYDGPTEPSEDLLHALVAAHGRTIPFENLDPLLGVPVGDPGPVPLVDKLVRRRRGPASQVLDVLDERFGVDVDDLGARSVVEARIAQVLDD